MASFLEFQRQYQADLVCLGHYITTDDSSVPGKPDSQPRLMTGEDTRRGLLLPPRMQGFCWNKLYRLDLIREHGLYFPDRMGTTEDLYFTYQYLHYCRTACHAPSRRVYHYYQREDSSTRSLFSREKMNTIRTFEHIIADCEAWDPELAQIARNEICTAAVNLLWENEASCQPDPEARAYLLSRICRLLPGYFRQTQYGPGWKIQALLAAVSPKAYMYLKNNIRLIFHRQAV